MRTSTSTASSDAIRQQDHRRREREELTLAKSEVPKWIVNALIEGGWLGEDESEDKNRLGEAIIKVLEESLTADNKLSRRDTEIAASCDRYASAARTRQTDDGE